MLPVLYSPNEPVHFLGFFTSWIRFRIRMDRREIFMRIHADPDPKHWCKAYTNIKNDEDTFWLVYAGPLSP